jgi:hypothetical protein
MELETTHCGYFKIRYDIKKSGGVYESQIGGAA